MAESNEWRELRQRLAQHDVSATEDLYDLLRQVVSKSFNRRVEEIVDDVGFRVVRRFWPTDRRGAEIRNLQAFCLDAIHHRARHDPMDRRSSEVTRAKAEDRACPSSSDAVVSRERIIVLLGCLEHLTDDERDILRLVYVNQLSIPEIVRRHGKDDDRYSSRSALEGRLKRIRGRIRELIAMKGIPIDL